MQKKGGEHEVEKRSREMTRDIKEASRIVPKTTSDDNSRLQNCPNTGQGSKKSILEGQVYHHAQQKTLKLALKTTPRQARIKTSYDVPNINAFEYSLKPPKQAFDAQNQRRWDTVERH